MVLVGEKPKNDLLGEITNQDSRNSLLRDYWIGNEEVEYISNLY